MYKKLRSGNHDAEAFTLIAWVEEDEEDEAAGGFLGLLRPHFTEAVCPSISTPFAHAWAACSADARSLKLTKAHLNRRVSKRDIHDEN